MARMATSAHTILIVEDDDDSRTLLGHLLTGQGYEVAMARNGLEGLRVAREFVAAETILERIVVDERDPVLENKA